MNVIAVDRKDVKAGGGSIQIGLDKIDELLVVIDKDVEYIQANLSRLDELRSLLVKKDQVGLNRLLDKVRCVSQNYRDNELKRQQLRRELGGQMGWDVKDVTLSKLARVVPADKGEKITEKKTLLASLTIKLQSEYIGTVRLLSDCSRFNKMLLKTILDTISPDNVSYNSKGSAQRQSESTFVNMKL